MTDEKKKKKKTTHDEENCELEMMAGAVMKSAIELLILYDKEFNPSEPKKMQSAHFLMHLIEKAVKAMLVVTRDPTGMTDILITVLDHTFQEMGYEERVALKTVGTTDLEALAAAARKASSN